MIDIYEHIEDYLKGRLSNEKKLAFESSLSHDKELRLVVDNYIELDLISDGFLELKLWDEVQMVAESTGNPNSNIYTKLVVVILIISALIWWIVKL